MDERHQDIFYTRVQEYLDALRLGNALDASLRAARAHEFAILSRWRTARATAPEAFGEAREERAEPRELFRQTAYEVARRAMSDDNYTDPVYVALIWRAVTDLGFSRGLVLEPAARSGVFIRLAPPGAVMTAVGLDPSTAAIAPLLYPDATIRTESFAESRFPDDHFDATVGHVPFGNVTLADPVHNRARYRLHEHFIIKSLALTRPGGVVAVITSHHTMDGQDPAARREMADYADLIGAVRLPTGAHRRVGTGAVTDLLLFELREPWFPQGDRQWESTTVVDLGDQRLRVNSYFAGRPDRVLGRMAAGTGTSRGELIVTAADLDYTPYALRNALSRIISETRGAGSAR